MLLGFSIKTNKEDYTQGTSPDATSSVILTGKLVQRERTCFGCPSSWKFCFQPGSGYKQADFGHAPLPLIFASHVRLKHVQRVTTRIRNGTKSCFLQTRLQGKPVMVSGMGEG